MSERQPKLLDAALVFPDVVLDLQDLLSDVDEQIYIIGGAVRDAYLRRLIKDVDLSTLGSGQDIARKIANRLGGAYYSLDSERDVGRALVETADGRLIFDVARFRGEDLLSDLLDRDFTLNAIAVDLRGDFKSVIDPLSGIDDLKAKVLRRCSSNSIPNDPLRALRAVRQSVQFGLRIESETLRDIRVVGAHLLDTSIERVRDELFRMLALPKPAAALRIADSVGLLTVIFPEIESLKPDHWRQTLIVIERLSDILDSISPARTDETAAQFSLGMLVMALDQFRHQLQQHLGIMWSDERSHKALLIFATILYSSGVKIAQQRAMSLHLSNAEKDHLITIIRNIDKFISTSDLSRITIYRFWKQAGIAGVDVILICLAWYLGEAGTNLDQDRWLDIIERARTLMDAYFMQRERLVDPPALVNGDDLISQLGVPRGPMIGELLEIIREAQVNGVVLSFEDALTVARSYLNNHR